MTRFRLGVSLGSILVSALGCGPAPFEATDDIDIVSYDLRGHFDWDRSVLVADVGISGTWDPASAEGISLGSAVSAVTSVRAGDSLGGAPLPFLVDPEAQTLNVNLTSLDGAEAFEVWISYEAASGEALRAVPARAGDPVSVRAVYTDSEPLDAIRWMPSHNDPSDRALFSVGMTMGFDETMIANGTLAGDVESEGRDLRTMTYQSDDPLPTYLMAFAISEFDVTEGEHGDTKLALWRRRGVAGDAKGAVAEIDRLFAAYEPLAGKYPFPSYALVILPDFSGGMENAGVTFQSELGGLEPSLLGDSGLTAHELGHQWFGDYATVATWDDVWIKEGMATLLEVEGSRAFEDQTGAGLFGGEHFLPAAGDAVRDTALAPADKYTTGPYDRAAWWWTQLRYSVGDDVFWATMRDLLANNAWGTLSAEKVFAAFDPLLDEAAADRANAALDAHALPTIELTNDADGAVATITLRDPEHTLIAPIEVEWRRADGTAERLTLAEDEPLDLARNDPGDFLVFDPDDVHPRADMFFSAEQQGALDPWLFPLTQDTQSSFMDLAGAHQRTAILGGSLWPVDPAEFAALRGGLHSEGARAAWLRSGCGTASIAETPEEQQAWSAALTAVAQGDPPLRGLGFSPRYSACADWLNPKLVFSSTWDLLETGLGEPDLGAPDVTYLAMFDAARADAFAVWGKIARQGYSIRVRNIAARRILSLAVSSADIGDGALLAGTVLDVLTTSEVTEVLRQFIPASAWIAVTAPERSADFLDALVAILGKRAALLSHGSAVCSAYSIAGGDGPVWDGVKARVDQARVSERAKGYLAAPRTCP